ncbi:hypothetical protein [Streptomyces sp. AC558_RSS880]|uniref:hypothetical protein n=1 Tax=Streptomyces sp. AC558_RSS880 TaxID=2823687 RepID=UPI001C21D097|nr:hypothetical protein [Streptomyces sp. AC558_RSS880]
MTTITKHHIVPGRNDEYRFALHYDTWSTLIALWVTEFPGIQAGHAVYRWRCPENWAEFTVFAFYTWRDDPATGARAGETIDSFLIKEDPLCTCCEHFDEDEAE